MKEVSAPGHPSADDPLPIPPFEMRQLVGPTDEAAFNNASGDPILDVPESQFEAVLDFGCGCGRLARQMMQQRTRPRRYVGFDLHQPGDTTNIERGSQSREPWHRPGRQTRRNGREFPLPASHRGFAFKRCRRRQPGRANRGRFSRTNSHQRLAPASWPSPPTTRDRSSASWNCFGWGVMTTFPRAYAPFFANDQANRGANPSKGRETLTNDRAHYLPWKSGRVAIPPRAESWLPI